MMSYAQWGNALYSGKKSYPIVGQRGKILPIGLTLIGLSILCLAVFGLNPSIEFTGGSQFTLSATQTNPPQQPAFDVMKKAGVTGPRVFQLGQDGLRIQTEQLPLAKERQVEADLLKVYKEQGGSEKTSISKDSIGPLWGATVSRQAIIGLITFLLLVVLLMIAYFRTWTMAFSALYALSHDFFITIGVYAITQVEVTPATIIGFLTILGYSLYDTVVVFDKIRENTEGMLDQSRSKYAELVNLSINQTMVRSINTSVVGILPVSAILFLGTFYLGGGTLRDIAMPLFIGMIVGTCSSIFVASPVLTWIRDRSKTIIAHNEKVDKARAALAAREEGGEATSGPAVGAVAAPLQPGAHLGQKAQPKRKKAKK